MEVLGLFIRAGIDLVVYAFVLSRIWRWVVVPKFKLPELDSGDVALLLLFLNAASNVMRSLNESTVALTAKIAAIF